MGTQSVFDKWSGVLDKMGVDNSKKHSISENGIYGSIPLADQISGTGSISNFPNILPVAMRVASQTIGLDMVSVKPMDGPITQDDIDKVEQELKRQNRQAKIDSILNGTEYKEKKELDKSERKSLLGKSTSPLSNLLYLDFQYGTSSSTNKKL